MCVSVPISVCVCVPVPVSSPLPHPPPPLASRGSQAYFPAHLLHSVFNLTSFLIAFYRTLPPWRRPVARLVTTGACCCDLPPPLFPTHDTPVFASRTYPIPCKFTACHLAVVCKSLVFPNSLAV